MSIKEKSKQYWKSFKKHYLIFFNGFIAGWNLVAWMLFFIGILIFAIAIISTILTVVALIVVLLMKSKYQKIMTKILYIVDFGGFTIGIFIWFIGSSLLMLRGIPSLCLMFPSCGLGAVIGYIIGKKRNWKTGFTRKTEEDFDL